MCGVRDSVSLVPLAGSATLFPLRCCSFTVASQHRQQATLQCTIAWLLRVQRDRSFHMGEGIAVSWLRHAAQCACQLGGREGQRRRNTTSSTWNSHESESRARHGCLRHL